MIFLSVGERLASPRISRAAKRRPEPLPEQVLQPARPGETRALAYEYTPTVQYEYGTPGVYRTFQRLQTLCTTVRLCITDKFKPHEAYVLVLGLP